MRLADERKRGPVKPECIKCFSEWLAVETDFSAGKGENVERERGRKQ